MSMMALVLAAVCVTNFVAQSVDKRLETADPAKSLSRFASYPLNATRGEFRANPAFWAKDIDFSCASPWNSDRGRLKAGTAISKRHVVFAKHFPLAVGTRIVFLGDSGDTSAYYIEKTKAMKRGDIMIGLLNAELTPDVHPAKVLPDNWTNYFPKIEGMPVVTLSQHEKALVNELMPPLTNSVYDLVNFHASKNYLRSRFREKIYVGDSGSPTFLIVDNEPILLFCLTTSMGGYGIHRFKREVQAIMDELCPGYKLEEFSFSSSRTLEEDG